MGILTTGSKKDQLKQASSTYIGTFKRIVTGLTKTNKEIDAEQDRAKKTIEVLKSDIKDYDAIKGENQKVIDGLQSMLGISGD